MKARNFRREGKSRRTRRSSNRSRSSNRKNSFGFSVSRKDKGRELIAAFGYAT
jgi:hypothetical protein